MSVYDRTTGFANSVQRWAGKTSTFFSAVALVIVWAFTGPMFHYSDTWQMLINTSTTIVTFLMGFLILACNIREGKATQLKLDEVLRAVKNARNTFIGIEDLSEEELESMRATAADDTKPEG